MKPIFILNRYSDDVRRQRASFDEIRDVAEGRSNNRLVHLAIGDEGDIVATPVSADDLREIAARLDAERATQLRGLLDDAAALVHKGKGLDGVNVGSLTIVSIWADDAPWAGDIVVAWATERSLDIKRSSPPTSGTHWHPDAEVDIDGVTVVRLAWPRREVNTESAIDDEVAAVSSERATAAAELEAF